MCWRKSLIIEYIQFSTPGAALRVTMTQNNQTSNFLTLYKKYAT